MKNAIVTGANGYIGTWLVQELLKHDIEITAIVRDSTAYSYTHKNDKPINVVTCDMCNYERLPELINKKEDTVFYHLAWNAVYGPERMNGPLQFANVEGARKAVVAAKALDCTAFIGIGSIMEREAAAVAEADEIKPSKAYIYGEAKHFAHLITKTEAASQGIAHIWPVLTNPYGEYDFSTRFINMALRKVINNEPLEFTSGTQIYDFIYAGDVAKALYLLGEKGKPYTTYTVGSGTPRPLREFVEIMLKAVAPDRQPLFGNIPYTGAVMKEEDFATEKLMHDTGFIPEMEFEDGIIKTMNWLKSQRK